MTFIELADSTQQPKTAYYADLLLHHEVIINEVGRTDKQTVANALNMQPSVFSIAYKFILAYNDLKG